MIGCQSGEMAKTNAELLARIDPDGRHEAAYWERRRGKAKESPSPAVGVSAPVNSRADDITEGERKRRAVAYLKRMPGGVQGQKGSDATYAAACAMVHGFGLAVSDAFAVLWDIHNPLCVPPWDEYELRKKCADAKNKAHREPFEYLLIRGHVEPDRVPSLDEIAANTPPVHPSQIVRLVGHPREGLVAVIEADDDPHRMARRILADHQYEGRQTLKFWMGSFRKWRLAWWETRGGETFGSGIVAGMRTYFEELYREKLLKFDNGELDKPPVMGRVTTGLTASVVAALKSQCTLDESEVPEAPAWINGSTPVDVCELVPAANGIVHLPDFIAGKPDAIRPPTPDFFNLHAVDFAVELNPPKPAEWLKFLDALWGDDPESIQLLQEWFGYLLTPDNSKQAALMLIGPPRAGKGTISRVLEALVGKHNCCGASLEGLLDPKGLTQLVGKSVCMIDDASISGKQDAVAISRVIRNITGGDSVSIKPLYKEAFSIRLPVRFVMSANQIPALHDPSGAIATRWRVLQFTKSFVGREDPNLSYRLIAELPGIFAWACEGWASLKAKGAFTRPASAEDAHESIMESASPVSAFVQERCILHPFSTATADDLFASWRNWCEMIGKDYHGSRESFGRELKAAIPGITRGRRRGSRGQREYYYHGIRLSVSGDSDIPAGFVDDCPQITRDGPSSVPSSEPLAMGVEEL